ncbi:major viral capsid protein 39 [Neodiprion abietis nucleopolyhedrovirus]|uniref:Major viral capsid protein 39 n=1 Tax=Neodiprion abietis nucleopolyhedrovirus TaxID=204507 RepID=Q0ZNY8_9CBAC|nr:major viral capsid protein 39 [Neodiprion abietis nucleopolyhedrovirus]ABC74966.1 major viral capsid protein 39 [Neodiprion abietis nucleopolyhedrovirus]
MERNLVTRQLIIDHGTVPAHERSASNTNECIFRYARENDKLNQTIDPGYNCSNYLSGLYICQKHLEDYFRLSLRKINQLEGTDQGRVFERLSVLSRLPHNYRNRVIVPTRRNYEDIFKVAYLPISYQLVFHLLYQNQSAIDKICQDVKISGNKFSINGGAIDALISDVKKRLAGIITTDIKCSVEVTSVTRTWESVPNIINIMDDPQEPLFIKNLITNLICPRAMVIDNKTFKFETAANVIFVEEGLIVDNLYNPEAELYPLYNNRTISVNKVTTVSGLPLSNIDVRGLRSVNREHYLVNGEQRLNIRENALFER